MGGSKPRKPKPAPAPEAAAQATLAQMSDTTREEQVRKKKKIYSLEDTVSVFDVNGEGGNLS